MYRVAQKLAQFLYALTLPNINRFSQLFHSYNEEKFAIKIPRTSFVLLLYLVKC